MSEAIRRQKRWLFRRQGGLCHWCGCAMIFPTVHLRHPPKNLATLDHLDDKFSADRGMRYGEIRHVMACKECNERRGRERELEQGIDELRRRSGRSPRQNATPIVTETQAISSD